ncbi:hypothetical protein BZM27_54535, partial [Paraburkholderia steynii]
LRKFLEIWGQQRPFTLQWARLFYMYGEGQNPRSCSHNSISAIDDGDAVFNMSGRRAVAGLLAGGASCAATGVTRRAP